MTRMTPRAGAVAALLLAVALAGCGSSQPSSAAEDVSATTAPSTAPASVEPSASAEPPSEEAPSTTPTAVAARKVPPKPGNPTFKRIDTKPAAAKGMFTETYRITWTEPDGVADSFLVYGMADCLRYSKQHDGEPCVVRGMPIDADTLTLLGVAPGDKRSMEVSWDVGEVDVPPYWTILIRAANSKGNSIFTIVKSYDVCFKCVY
jgi:hypothetical protein